MWALSFFSSHCLLLTAMLSMRVIHLEQKVQINSSFYKLPWAWCFLIATSQPHMWESLPSLFQDGSLILAAVHAEQVAYQPPVIPLHVLPTSLWECWDGRHASFSMLFYGLPGFKLWPSHVYSRFFTHYFTQYFLKSGQQFIKSICKFMYMDFCNTAVHTSKIKSKNISGSFESQMWELCYILILLECVVWVAILPFAFLVRAKKCPHWMVIIIFFITKYM